MADVIKAAVLVVEIVAVGVRVPVVPAIKMDFGVTPHRRCPIVRTGREWNLAYIYIYIYIYIKDRQQRVAADLQYYHLFLT